MDIVIFSFADNEWFFATPTEQERSRAPFNIIGNGKTWRLWPAADLSLALWEAAKSFFLDLSDDTIESAAA